MCVHCIAHVSLSGTHTYTIEEVPSTAVPVYTPLQTLDYQPATGGRDFLERGNLQELLTTDTADSGRIFTLWNDHIEMHFTDQGAPKRYVRKAKAADAAADAKSAAKEVSRREWYLRHDMMYYTSDGSWANQYTFRSQQDLPARPAAPIARGAQNGGGVWVLIKGRLRSELLVQETDAIARRYRVDQFADFVEVVDQISPDVGVPAVRLLTRTSGVVYVCVCVSVCLCVLCLVCVRKTQLTPTTRTGSRGGRCRSSTPTARAPPCCTLIRAEFYAPHARWSADAPYREITSLVSTASNSVTRVRAM